MNTRTLIAAAAGLVLPTTVIADSPRLIMHEVPVIQHQCGQGTIWGIATALGEDGSVAGVANCGTTTYGSRSFYTWPDGTVQELDGGSFTFSSPDFVFGSGITVGTGDWCPPVNGSCTTALVIQSVGGPTAIVASNANMSTVVKDGNMSGWACGWGGISPTNAWRLNVNGTLEFLAVPGAWGVNSENVSNSGYVAGSAYVSNQGRAIRWNPGNANGVVLPSLIAGTASSAYDAADDGSVAGRSGDRATVWDMNGVPTALLPSGLDSQATHIAGNPMAGSPLAVAYFGNYSNDTRLFRAQLGLGWEDLGPQAPVGESFIMVNVVAAPRADFMVAKAHTQMYQPVQFLWTQTGGMRVLKSCVVDMPTGLGDLNLVDANHARQILVNSTQGHKTFILEFLSPGDTNGDGIVDGADLGRVLGAWGDVPAGTRGACDFDGNGIVDGADLGVVLGNWTN